MKTLSVLPKELGKDYMENTFKEKEESNGDVQAKGSESAKAVSMKNTFRPSKGLGKYYMENNFKGKEKNSDVQVCGSTKEEGKGVRWCL
jgi:hypothetical protein